MSREPSLGSELREKSASAEQIEEFDAMIEQLDGAISVASEKIESGRVYEPENEKVRIQWLRALAYLIRTKRKVWSDRSIIEMWEQIEEIDERRDRGRYR